MREYEELRIRIWKIGASRYLVFANGPSAAAAVVTLRRSPEDYISARQGVRQLGQELFETFFPKPLHDCLNQSLHFAVHDRQRALRVRLDIAPELRGIPFEMFCAPPVDPLGFLALNPNISLVRSMPGAPILPLRIPAPQEGQAGFHLLVVVAPSIDGNSLLLQQVQGVLAQLVGSLNAFRGLGLIGVEFLGGPWDNAQQQVTWNNLAQRLGALAQNPRPSAVLVIAPSEYDKKRREGVVALQKVDGTPDRVPSNALAQLIASVPGLRFAALSLYLGTQSLPFDPSIDVAQPLIASGIPAVVMIPFDANNGAVNTFIPGLFLALCRNQWVDEAVASACLMMAQGGTPIEGSMPRLFLHTEYSYGWLFKVPPILPPGMPDPGDPLQQHHQNLNQIGNAQAGIPLDNLGRAAWYRKTQGDWPHVEAIADLALQVAPAHAGVLSLKREARVEQHLQDLQSVCQVLAQEDDPHNAAPILLQLQGSLQHPVLLSLVGEVQEEQQLLTLSQQATTEEEREKWNEALQIYDEMDAILTRRASDYREAKARRQRVQQELQLTMWYSQARNYLGGEHNLPRAVKRRRAQQAVTLYEAILQQRPGGYKDARQELCCAKGWLGFAKTDWHGVVVTLRGLPDIFGIEVQQLRLYAQGRLAEKNQAWHAACTVYQSLGSSYRDLEYRLPYAEGRVAEGAEEWQNAVVLYEALASRDYRDVPLRLPYVRGRVAIKNQNWEKALAAFLPLPEAYRDVQAQVRYVHDQLYQQGVAAEGKECWAKAVSVYELLPEDFGDIGKRRPYVQGRVEEQDKHWADASQAYGRVQKGFLDIDMRLLYAQARLAEARECWSEAAETFECLTRDFDSLPEDYRGEVQNRRRYARGRVAEQEGKWQGVLEGFEGLSNDYGGGDVGARRAYARAQVEANKEEWADVEEALRELPDDHREGEVGQFRRYAQGRQAEKRADWMGATAAYEVLPVTYGDVQQRCCYTQGRLAEEQPDWAKAVNAYKALPEDYQDVALRCCYIRGRQAEEKDDWAAAVKAYEGLDRQWEDYHDVRERWWYAQGRVAEQDGNWQEVLLKGFGDLPDAYRDVGARRAYARAQEAAGEQRWASVDEALRGLPNDYRAGEVGQLRHYAQGRRAEEQADWTGAVAAYEKLAERYQDVQQRCRYAQGRQAEEQGDWPGAVAAYEVLPAAYRDVQKRHSYAQGRQAEEQEDWPGAVRAYKELPEDHRDVQQRCRYVQGRQAETGHDWTGVLTAVEALPNDYRDVAQWRSYAQGRKADEAEDWGTALHAYEPCGAYQDAPQRGAYTRGRLSEAAGEWRYALEAYQSLPADYRDVGQRQERLEELLEVMPCLDGLSSTGLFADPLATRYGVCPYEALKAAGITPNSSAEEVRNASFVLMEQGAMTPEARLAWDQLRSLANRLKVDAFFYGLQDAEGLQSFQQRLAPGLQMNLVEQLCRELPSDAPLFYLIANRREQAIAIGTQRLKQNPGDVAIARALGIAYYWYAQDLEARGAYERAEEAWKQAIAYWTLVLSDDGFWAQWRQKKTDCYEQLVVQSDIARLRSELGQELLNCLARYADRYTTEGRLERAEKYRELALAMEVELEGARALKEVGGLPLADSQNLTCGPLYLGFRELERELGRWVLKLAITAGAEAEPDDIITTLDTVLQVDEVEGHAAAVAPVALDRLRRVFSELGKSVLLLEHDQPERALQALPTIAHQKLAQLPEDCDGLAHSSDEDVHLGTCKTCPEFLPRNPGYLYLPHRYARLLQDAVDLATRAHLALAQTVLTSGKSELDEVLRHWEKAIEVARNAGAQVRTKRAVVRVVSGRAEALSNERGRRRGERLTEALSLIERVRPLIGGADDKQLVAKASEVLTDRGVWYGYGCRDYEEPNYEKAVNDLRRALQLNPGSLNARDNLARALIFPATDLREAGNRQRPLELAAEALAVLHEGLQQTAGHRQLLRMLLQALDELEEVVLHDLSVAQLARRMDEIASTASEAPAIGSSQAQTLATRAAQKLHDGDVPGAVLLLIRTVRYSPENDTIRQSLLQAVERIGHEPF